MPAKLGFIADDSYLKCPVNELNNMLLISINKKTYLHLKSLLRHPVPEVLFVSAHL